MKSIICLLILSSAFHAQANTKKDFESLNFRQICGSNYTLSTNYTGASVRCDNPIYYAVVSAPSGDYLKGFVPKNAKTPWSLGLVELTADTWYEVRTFELVDRDENLVGHRIEYDFPELRLSYRFIYERRGRVVSLQMMNF